MSAPRNGGLDVLRTFAVALVFMAHLPTCPPGESEIVNRLTIPLVRGGWVGVDIFFALSGYLIAGLLFREQVKYGRINAGQFMMRRAWKILPPLLVLVAVTCIVRYAVGIPVEAWSVVAALFFFANYVGGMWGNLWSLGVEEQFYLFIPAALALTARRVDGGSKRTPWPWLPAILGVLIVGTIAVSVAMALRDPAWVSVMHFRTEYRVSALAVGVALAYVEAFAPRVLAVLTPRARRLLVVLGLVILMPAFAWDSGQVPVFTAAGYTLYPLAGAFLIVGMEAVPVGSSRVGRVAARVGERSYSLYLWHEPVFVAMTSLLRASGPSWATLVATNVIVAIVVGLASAEWIELPALRMRDRLLPRRVALPA